ncbi:MAG: tyrosine-type recombinase/integrase, partial [Lachnospiraceae bacterium]|nr:tyrosine-type recombinase/integrase [Lachnospiraceae bacterium]
HGKGSKERRIQLANTDVIVILESYKSEFSAAIRHCNNFFVNQSGRPLSEQSVRRMINKYTNIAGIDQHITPHMFRHTFATSLLEADVDIRYIQEMLGHSSINITEIYTHVAVAKQRDILMTKHPRKDFNIH